MNTRKISIVIFFFMSLMISSKEALCSNVDARAQDHLIAALAKNNAAQAIEALKAGANPLALDDSGETPLHNYLLQHSDEKDTQETILMVDRITDFIAEQTKAATREAVFGRIGVFLGQKPKATAEIVSLDIEDQNGLTPLFLALILGYNRIAQILQEKGAEINYKNHLGNSFLNIIAKNELSPILMLAEKMKKLAIKPVVDLKQLALLSAKQKPKPNFVIPKKPVTTTAAQTSQEEVACIRALSMGAEINARGAQQRTPIIDAVIAKNYPIITQLLWHAPEPVKLERGRYGMSLRLFTRNLTLRDTFNKSALDYAKSIADFDQSILHLLESGTPDGHK